MSATNLPNDLALHVAVRCNNLPEIERLLQLGADVNARDYENENRTALHVAAIENRGYSHYAAMKILLQYGADVNAQDIYGYSVLHIVVNRRSHTRTVELLLYFGAYVKIKNKIDGTPFSNALSCGTIETVKLLIDRGAYVNIDGLHNVLNVMIHTDVPEKIKYLLKIGLDIETRDYENCTPFYRMILRYNDIKNLTFFFKYANFNNVDLKRDYNLRSFMFVFCRYEHISTTVLKYLAKYQVLDLPVNLIVLESISKHNKLNDFFIKCLEELEMAKSTKLQGCWITYFNLLVDNKRKLKNYSGNEDLIKYFKNSDCLNKFPIYGPEMIKNVEKGIKRRKLFDDSTIKMSCCLPIFNPTHLVIRDILDCLSFKDCEKFLTVNSTLIIDQKIIHSPSGKIWTVL